MSSCASLQKRQEALENRQSVLAIIKKIYINEQGQKRRSPFYLIDDLVFGLRTEVSKKFNINTDTNKLKRFITLDLVSLEGGKPIFGEMLSDDSLYIYEMQYKNEITRLKEPPTGMAFVLDALRQHDFSKLDSLSKSLSPKMSGSSFFYIGMYDKEMDSVYVRFLPAFIIKQ